jgi:rubrerythrin
MSKTEKNLQDAFAGESQANRKYLAFSKKAEEEGFMQIARLFRAAAEAETVHAHNHLNVLGGVKSTSKNLEEAINGESYEFQKMYPQMMADAKSESNNDAWKTFYYANEVEKIHADLYMKAHKYLGDIEEVEYWVCQVCGNTMEGEAPDTCPICGAKAEQFKKIN